ncbi:Uncharacterized protein TCM_044224 [Theobroma cacao]|uniref:Uncharacterized protein n=1 Tax=Theobroma cacao TaxID=3641 RepID=A0A061FRH1_THECC|nr:Uncharacterized protein TCM_044224 [Theobroma cacao]
MLILYLCNLHYMHLFHNQRKISNSKYLPWMIILDGYFFHFLLVLFLKIDPITRHPFKASPTFKYYFTSRWYPSNRNMG